MLSDFYHNEPGDTIWWVDDTELIGAWLFSFYKVKGFNMFEDYPWELTEGQREIFDRENPQWAEFFKDRR